MSEARPPEASPDEHDAWLHQALRHAPDAAAAPPNALREAILAEARSAVRASRTAPPRSAFVDQLAAFWSWLARPQVAAGFAGVMAATLVGMMWWDRPMDETLAPPPSRTIAQPEAAHPPPPPPVADTLSATGSAAAPTTTPATAAPSVFAGKRATPTTTTAAKAAPKAVEEDKQRKDQAPMNAMQSAPGVSPFPSADSTRSEAGARNQAANALAKKEDAENKATTTASPPRVLAPEPSPAAAPPATARPADAALADAKGGAIGELAKTAPVERQRAATTTRDAADALVARGAPAPAASPAPQAFAAAAAPPAREANVASERRGAADTSARPMAALLGSLSGNPERWTRPVAGGAPARVTAAAEAWLASVDAATAGRWQARAERTARLDGAIADEAGTLPLSRDGRPAAVVRLEEGGVFFELQPGPAWFAPLPADALARLRASLPPIPR